MLFKTEEKNLSSNRKITTSVYQNEPRGVNKGTIAALQ